MAKGTVKQGDGDARRDLARRRMLVDPPPIEARGPNKVAPGEWTPNFRTGLPSDEGCEFPVQCLGVLNGHYHLVDSAGEFRSEPSYFFTHAGIQDIFSAAPNYIEWCCPRWKKIRKGEQPKIESFKDDQVRKLIFFACSRNGLFNPSERLRGRGAWKLRGGQLIYHAGEELWTCEGGRLVTTRTGMHYGHLYPRMPELPAPWEQPITPENNPARNLVETFRKWNWERPEIDPVLLLGWLAVAFLGGALDWRSALFLIGGYGTGKSTLQEGLKNIFGDALFQSADTTAAGIYQKMAHDSRPVAVDELEAEADPRKVNAVVKLARAASSGAMGSRGGSDGQGSEFQMRSAFLFSAINNPLQSAQDLSRVAILRLRSLNPDQPPPPPIDVDVTGRMVLGQLMREWHRWEPTLTAYRAALAAGGHTARGQATYGALLAGADLLLGADLASELGIETVDLSWWTAHMGAELLPEVEDAKPNWRACIEHLLTAKVEQWRNGHRATVGRLLDDMRSPGAGISFDEAQRDLNMTGLGLVDAGIAAGKDEGYVLAVPNQSQLVAQLFAGTPWAGTPGASGPWKDALRQALEHGITIVNQSVNRVRINGVQTRCTLIVLSRFHSAPER